MTLAALIILVIHLFTKPFEKTRINVIETMILLDLLIVTAVFLVGSLPDGLGITLVILPYLYAAGFLLYKLISRLW